MRFIPLAKHLIVILKMRCTLQNVINGASNIPEMQKPNFAIKLIITKVLMVNITIKNKFPKRL